MLPNKSHNKERVLPRRRDSEVPTAEHLTQSRVTELGTHFKERMKERGRERERGNGQGEH